MTIGERLRAQRIKCGYTCDEVAQLLGVTRSAVSSWELDVAYPRRHRQHLIADVLGTTWATLFGEQP